MPVPARYGCRGSIFESTTDAENTMSDKKRRATDHEEGARETAEASKPEGNANAGAKAANPPRTTTWRWFTAPKFGSAGSGGAELEPGPERE
jgi:hypothetical protein